MKLLVPSSERPRYREPNSFIYLQTRAEEKVSSTLLG